ncbi:ATP-dependent helicase (plasmid) [Sphingomonas naphthae]|jgi:DNA helicase II / ATP-dependent DNA helicase PcrA|uniref:DNA 3'-5' helicase n=1 Tax=Sphingomonas naphthae TaxID=1813468 RepID=A0ABY7TRD7_9SPHN|nr:ATP-dependent helicase [Sphingomonas naphthae]WCT75781.1 ATP-dependent helicase [Sphingomonas naphthae]
MFVWNADDLNADQVKAIEQPGSVFLTACPGSGKTRTLTYKIARELSLLTSDKQRIVAITYTHRAADEIQERIEQLGVDTSQLWIGTIHSFCLEWILRPYAIYHPELKNGFRVINAHDTERAHELLCSEHGGGLRTFDCGHYFTSAGHVIACPDWKRAKVEALLQQYWAELRANRQVDFEMILDYAYQLVRDIPSISVLLGSIFATVLVDEYQDTKEIQYAILGAILKASGGKAKAFIVGDPNQAIYGSLGGYAITPAAFSALSGVSFTEMDLTVNYRSSDRIVTYFENFNQLTSKISAGGKYKSFASAISYDSSTNRTALVDEVVRLIRYNVESMGIVPREVCIVGPQWLPLAGMTRQLVAALPDYSFSGPGMVPFARDIDNFWYKLSRIILTEASPQLYIRRSRWAGEVIAALDLAGINTASITRKSLLRASNTTTSAETDGLKYLLECFDAFFDALGIDRTSSPMLVEHYEAFVEGSQRRIERLIADGATAIAEVAMFRKVFDEKTGITVSTIHGVKGAEFEAVIAFGLLEGMVPHFNEDDKIAAANKLLYVICSRAKKNLHLISEVGRRRGQNNVYQPTDILLACTFGYDQIP